MRFTRLPISGPPTGWGALPARVAAKPAGSARGLRFGIIDAAGEPEGPHAAAAAFAFGWATRWARAKRLICSAVGYAKDTFTSPLTSMSGRTSRPFISICSATGAHSSNAEG